MGRTSGKCMTLDVRYFLFSPVLFFPPRFRSGETAEADPHGRWKQVGHGVPAALLMAAGKFLVQGMANHGFTVYLKNGDRVIFYTDGLAESLTGNFQTEKFNELKKYFCSRPEPPAGKAPWDILSHHPFLVGGNARTGDFTVLVIERRKKELS